MTDALAIDTLITINRPLYGVAAGTEVRIEGRNWSFDRLLSYSFVTTDGTYRRGAAHPDDVVAS